MMLMVDDHYDKYDVGVSGIILWWCMLPMGRIFHCYYCCLADLVESLSL